MARFTSFHVVSRQNIQGRDEAWGHKVKILKFQLRASLCSWKWPSWLLSSRLLCGTFHQLQVVVLRCVKKQHCEKVFQCLSYFTSHFVKAEQFSSRRVPSSAWDYTLISGWWGTKKVQTRLVFGALKLKSLDSGEKVWPPILVRNCVESWCERQAAAAAATIQSSTGWCKKNLQEDATSELKLDQNNTCRWVQGVFFGTCWQINKEPKSRSLNSCPQETGKQATKYQETGTARDSHKIKSWCNHIALVTVYHVYRFYSCIQQMCRSLPSMHDVLHMNDKGNDKKYRLKKCHLKVWTQVSQHHSH